MTTSQSTSTPRIYVACLAAYNSGRLHGVWIDIDELTSAEDIRFQVQQMLQSSPVEDAEEWAIHTFEDWQGIEISEQESFERLVELAEILREHGTAFAAFCQCYGTDATLDDFRDRYQGQYKSEEDFAQEMWEEQGILQQLQALGIELFYIDWEAVGRDLLMSSYHSVNMAYQEIYVFSH